MCMILISYLIFIRSKQNTLQDFTTFLHFIYSNWNKSVFSYLRTLTMWHCPHSAATAAAMDRYLLPTRPTAANRQPVGMLQSAVGPSWNRRMETTYYTGSAKNSHVFKWLPLKFPLLAHNISGQRQYHSHQHSRKLKTSNNRNQSYRHSNKQLNYCKTDRASTLVVNRCNWTVWFYILQEALHRCQSKSWTSLHRSSSTGSQRWRCLLMSSGAGGR